jgi:hypothetical protein
VLIVIVNVYTPGYDPVFMEMIPVVLDKIENIADAFPLKMLVE